MAIEVKEIILNEERNVRLKVMLHEVGGEYGAVSNRPAVLILPGGGDQYCSVREAEEYAFPFLYAGYHAFVLRYSVGIHNKWPNKLDDYELAMETIRNNAEDWHIIKNKIAVAGSSAGGHLAACAATMSKNRPDAAILCYAALDKEVVSGNQPIPSEYVDSKTPPCFLVCARDDCIVSAKNTVNFEMALLKNGISYESHIYAYGGHGFATAQPSITSAPICSRAVRWMQDCIEWLGDMFGNLTSFGMGEPAFPPKVNGNSEEIFNIDCTVEYLRTNGPKDILVSIFNLIEKVGREIYETDDCILDKVPYSRLSDLMKIANVPQTEIDKLNFTLKQFPNTTKN